MVDAVPPAARCAPLQAQQLRGKATVVEQVDLTAVQAGKKVAINPDFERSAVRYSMPAFPKAWETHSVP